MPYTPAALVYKLLLYPLLRLYWLTFRPDVLGVRCVVEFEGRVLLIRNPYGPMKWELPGGGVRRGERPEDAARREVFEEVGILLTELRPLGRYTGTEYYVKDTVVGFYSSADNPALRPRRAEVYEEGWFEWGRLPEPLSREAKKIIGLYRASEGL
ncbi:MAG TPA: NUDIX domain-containing protein [Pyrinomonadaceae bacterium]